MGAVSRRRVVLLLIGFAALATIAASLLSKDHGLAWLQTEPQVTKPLLAETLSAYRSFDGFPNEVDLQLGEKKEKVILQYSFDPDLQSTMTRLLAHYRPDYGAFVAMDAKTGRVLSLVSYADRNDLDDNLVLRASFPSASIFKVVTAAAAITERKFTADTMIPFNGSKHTLYKSNVLKFKENRWTRLISLKQAFAESVNPVFAKIGVNIGAPRIQAYAEKFGFNRKIAADLPVDTGYAQLDGDDWQLAEVSSGFTRETRMSPMQGALIAAAIVNDGLMMEPFVIQSVHKPDGATVYQASVAATGTVVEPRTARELRELGSLTVTKGTSRKSFRGFFRTRGFENLEVGGKTGSLTGDDPRGKYDWFVGWADGPQGKIAVAALTIHREYWKVKSSYLARVAFENYFSELKAKPQSRRRVADRSLASANRRR